MTRREKICIALEELGFEDVLMADGLDDAMIGISTNSIAVYDADKCVNVFARDNACDPAEAEEFLSFNTFCAYVGEKTPIFLYDIEEAIRQTVPAEPPE